MNAEALMAKAEQAAASAKLLLESGDSDGACNRAYYAMFDAARAALFESAAPAETESIRTHGGLISAFSLQLVKPGHVDIEHGRALNKVSEIRLIADYRGEPVGYEHATWTVERAIAFVQVIRADFFER